MENFEILRKPLKVGNLVLKHRMTMAPMDALRTESGEITQQLIDYYSARAKGGAALIIIQIACVDGRHLEGAQPRIDEDRFIPGMQRLAQIIHSDGVPVIVQLHIGGPTGNDPISPSGIPCLTQTGGIIKPRAMSLKEVEEARDLYIEGAIRIKKAGFDGVELHGATGYLLQNFISPKINRRTDIYGGNLENRMRLPLEIVRGIRQSCGPEFIIGYALVSDDLLPDGTTLAESVPFTVALEKEGADFVDIRVGTHQTLTISEKASGHSKHQTREGIWEYSEAFKKALKIPVFCSTSGCYNAVLWKKALEHGQADIVQIAKPLLCDPELPKKILENRLEDIRPCTLCVYCMECRWIGQSVSCALNTEMGYERGYAIKPAPEVKKVLIVGGGPGGLEAARVAALRGHKVTIMEKASELGGNLRILSLCAGNDLYLNYRDWLVKQCTQTGVKFELNKEVTSQVVRDAKPDVVIVATGAPVPIIPPIPGINKPHVSYPEDILSAKVKIGKNVVIIGGNFIGVDTAFTIAAKGLAESITIVEPLRVPVLAYDMETFTRTYLLMTLLPKYNVQGYTGMRIEAITDREVVLAGTDGKRQKIKGDTVIIALGHISRMNLYEALRGENIELYAIGDCQKARKVADAVREGSYLARQI